MKKLLAVLLAMVLILSSGPGVLAAPSEAQAIFQAGPVGADGTFTVTFTLKNATFNAFQFTIGYDPKELVLVDPSGAPAQDPGEYQENLSGGWLSQIGCEGDNTKGFFGFTGFIMPGQGAMTPLNEDGTATAPESGLELFRFRFKRVGEIRSGFRLAYEIHTNGIAGLEGRVPFSVEFRLPDNKEESIPSQQVQKLEEETQAQPEPAAPGDKDPEPQDPQGSGEGTAVSPTKDEKLAGSVAMQEGNQAAVVEGKRQTIYPGEKGISPFNEEGFFYVPIRFVVEKLGGKVAWHGDTRTVTIEKGSTKAELTVGSSKYTANGMDFVAKRKVFIVNNRTMVPADVLENVLGLQLTTGGGLAVFAPSGSPLVSGGIIDGELLNDFILLLSPLIGVFDR